MARKVQPTGKFAWRGGEAGNGFPGLFAAPVVLDTFYSPSSGSTRHARARIAQQRGLKANPDRQAAGKLRFACCQIGAASAECSRRLISIFAMNAAARASASGSRGGRGLSFQFHALLLGLCCTIRGTIICRQGGFRALWAGLVTMVLGSTLCCAWGGGNVSAGDAADCVAYNSVCVTGKNYQLSAIPVFQLRTICCR